MNKLNYAKVYSDQLSQTFPRALNFGALYATDNNNRFRFKGGKTIEIPHISIIGRKDVDRDAIEAPSRNYENEWIEFELTNQRKWSTLIHPADIDQTDYATSIANITSVYNNEYKFPEMDAYVVSKLFADWDEYYGANDPVKITADNVLDLFDTIMLNMTEALVPVTGRILYVTPTVMNALKKAASMSRNLVVNSVDGDINRTITMLDGVQVIVVPSAIMRTEFNFDQGASASLDARQVGMLLVHPDAIITPVSYQFACLDEPSAATGGKYVYYEESFEDVFILPHRAEGVAFVLEDFMG